MIITNLKQLNVYSLLQIYIGLILCIVTAFFVSNIVDGKIFLVDPDETTFYNAARLFSETGSLKATACINEERSIIGGFNWYGPAYNIIYGSIAKVIGFNNSFFIILNYFLFIATLPLIFYLPLNKLQRLFFASIFLSSYASYSFIFTYYPEMLHLVFSLILLLLYTRARSSPKLIYLFIFLVLVFSLVRITTVFWIFALLFLDFNRPSFKIRVLISMLVFVFVLVWMKFCNAPAFVGVQGLSMLQRGDFLDISFLYLSIKTFIMQGLINLYKFLLYANTSVVFVLILLSIAIINLFTYFNNKRQLQEAGLIVVSSMVFITLLVLYLPNPHLFEKQIAFIVPPLIYVLVIKKKNDLTLIISICFVFAPISAVKANNNIVLRRDSFERMKYFDNKKSSFNQIQKFVSPTNSEINILYSNNEFNVTGYRVICYLPVSKQGVPILYTTNIASKNTPPKVKFQLHNRIRVDYVLSKDSISLPNMHLLFSNNDYYFYKKRDN